MHGGEFETSFMLHRHGELVKEEEFTPVVFRGCVAELIVGTDVGCDVADSRRPG